ncbi:MAG: RNA pseudouridine synthase [Treponema sp.]|jgi:23S rRNA pseudouridine1911/1915/1917 synthase|nr:RNA pseudouridine synthase [Treponema sp.]
MSEPNIVDLKPDYLVAYKPPRMHSVFLKKQDGREDREDTLLDWCSRLYPEVPEVKGRNPWEGGILHRLDYETEGLVLFARTQEAMDSFLVQQKEGSFSKTYGAFSVGTMERLPGYPPKPRMYPSQNTYPLIVESGFRPYGPGRKTVRPVIHPGVPPEKIYRTWILAVENVKGFTVFAVRIQRGFRHQIRCHLAWLGFPLVNDSLYGGAVIRDHKPLNSGEGVLPPDQPFLALRAQGLSFRDPVSGESREYTLPPIVPPAF